MAELGLMGVTFPAAQGGAGLGHAEYVITLEELARIDGSVALIVSAHSSVCANHIRLTGTEEEKRKYLVPLARGERLGCWSLTEPGSGSDASAVRTTARLDGDSRVLNGVKNFVTNGHYAGEVAVRVTNEAIQIRGG
jgi:alkylation response protein AidB-like acyl-CoA dehydrogenase